VSSKVHRNKPEFVGKRAFPLAAPSQVMLRPAMHKQDGRRVSAAPFPYVQSHSASTHDRYDFDRCLHKNFAFKLTGKQAGDEARHL
jgi:hypothetical protein